MSDHPKIWPGVNTAALAGDEFNGAGVNSTVWLDLIDAIAPSIIAATQDSFFDKIDASVSTERQNFAVPRERRNLRTTR